MKKKLKTKFYYFNQNNPGGSFHMDNGAGICENVVIEALDAAHAESRAEHIGLYFDGCDNNRDCKCCGDRWSRLYSDKGDDKPSIYGKPITEQTKKELFSSRCFIHYIDNPFKEVKFI